MVYCLCQQMLIINRAVRQRVINHVTFQSFCSCAAKCTIGSTWRCFYWSVHNRKHVASFTYLLTFAICKLVYRIFSSSCNEFASDVFNTHHCTEGLNRRSVIFTCRAVTWVTFRAARKDGKMFSKLTYVSLSFFFLQKMHASMSHFGGFSNHISNLKPFDNRFLSQTLSRNIHWSA